MSTTNPFEGMTPEQLQALRDYAAAQTTDKPGYTYTTGANGIRIGTAPPVPTGLQMSPEEQAAAIARMNAGFGTGPGQWGEAMAPGGELSLGGQSASPKPQASGGEQQAGSGASNNATLEAFLQALQGQVGNASPVAPPVGRVFGQQNTPQYENGVNRPNYGTYTQKGLLP